MNVSSEKHNIRPILTSNPVTSTADINVTGGGVRKLLSKFKNVFKSAGPYGIPARLLLEVANEIAPAPSLLFNIYLERGIVPNDGKQAIIFLLYKSGKKR